MLRRTGHAMRMMVPDELFMLQGMPERHITGNLSERQLVDLAGNAFCTVNALPTILASVMLTYPFDRF